MIAADIASPEAPRTAPGILVAALARRLEAGHAVPCTALGVAAFLAQDDVVPSALSARADFTQAVTTAYRTLIHDGLAGALAALARG